MCSASSIMCCLNLDHQRLWLRKGAHLQEALVFEQECFYYCSHLIWGCKLRRGRWLSGRWLFWQLLCPWLITELWRLGLQMREPRLLTYTCLFLCDPLEDGKGKYSLVEVYSARLGGGSCIKQMRGISCPFRELLCLWMNMRSLWVATLLLLRFR